MKIIFDGGAGVGKTLLATLLSKAIGLPRITTQAHLELASFLNANNKCPGTVQAKDLAQLHLSIKNNIITYDYNILNHLRKEIVTDYFKQPEVISYYHTGLVRALKPLNAYCIECRGAVYFDFCADYVFYIYRDIGVRGSSEAQRDELRSRDIKDMTRPVYPLYSYAMATMSPFYTVIDSTKDSNAHQTLERILRILNREGRNTRE